MPILVLVYITWECSLAVKKIYILEIIYRTDNRLFINLAHTQTTYFYNEARG